MEIIVLMILINNLENNDFEYNLMRYWTKTGNDWAYVIYGSALFIFGGKKEKQDAILLATGGIPLSLTVSSIKYITNRKRPTGESDRLNSSFPSGHSALAFFTAEILSNRHPKFKIFLYIWAVGVAISRVYLQRHYPSDVIAGALLGFLSAKLTLKYQNKILDFAKHKLKLIN